MARMKTFLIYLLIFVAFFLFSTLLINLGMKSVYKEIKEGKIFEQQSTLQITEAQATYVNGYIEGIYTNNTESKVEKKYIKLDLYSKRNVLLDTKYVKIENLDAGKKQNFRMGFRAKEVYKFEASVVDEAENANEEQFKSIEMNKTMIFYAILLLCFIG